MTLDQIIPAVGDDYRRRSDGLIARVVSYRRFDGVLLVDRASRRHRESPRSFWLSWVHSDIYDTERN